MLPIIVVRVYTLYIYIYIYIKNGIHKKMHGIERYEEAVYAGYVTKYSPSEGYNFPGTTGSHRLSEKSAKSPAVSRLKSRNTTIA